VSVESTLYPSITLLEVGRDIMPTPQGWEGNCAYFVSVKPSNYRGVGIITLLFIHLVIYIGLAHDKFCDVLYDR
jgi:hypothetical protein